MSIITLTLLLFLSHTTAAAFELPEIIGHHAVLQQQARAKLWGWAKPGATVSVTASWDNQTMTTKTGKDGRWTLYVQTPEASFTPHTLTFRGDGQTVELQDILVGEVWFCSGQSNMVMPLEGLRNCPTREGNEEIAFSARYADRVRVATIPQDQMKAMTPQERVHGQWSRPCPEEAPKYSAVAWFYATALTQMLNMPVGVIVCAWGGSRVEGWLPKEYLQKNAPEEDLSGTIDKENGPNKSIMALPMVMYNGMLRPVMGYTIKGFLWNQGESNNRRGLDTYAQRFTDMVSIWREQWGQKGDALPFYTVELPPHWYRDSKGTNVAKLRVIQHELAKSVPHCGCICTNDLVDDYEETNIHGSIKRPIGQRLAYMAAHRTYGIGSAAMCDAPVLDSMRHEGPKQVILAFSNVDNGFSRFADIPGFEAAGKDRKFYPAKASVTMKYNELRVVCDEVEGEIEAVRYNFHNWAPGRFWNTRGLPIVPFRTDDWPL